MNSKKLNLFALFMMIVMCAVTIFVSVGRKDNDSAVTDEILSIYKKIEKLDKKIDENQGDSAYELAVKEGYTGNINEWLASLKGSDGENKVANITANDLYQAYLVKSGKTEVEYSYEDFLKEYYSSGMYNEKYATDAALSSTVDICYGYTTKTYPVQSIMASGQNAYIFEYSGSDWAAAGAGVIYKMLDTDSNGSLDTAYIITNYHVAYIENYSNDSNYVAYYNVADGSYFLGSEVPSDSIKHGRNFDSSTGNIVTYNYFLENSITRLSTEEGLTKHFLNGTNGQYYGIYLYGYNNSANYKMNATFVGGSADNDIAVLKIERDDLSSEMAEVLFASGSYYQATIRESTSLSEGEKIIAVGNPLIANVTSDMTMAGKEQSFVDSMVLSSTGGIVSVVSDEQLFSSILNSSLTTTMRLIRVDAAINSGNSGGGLYDLHGNLVGIVNSKMASSTIDNMGFAIPINVAKGVADQVISQCDGTANTRIKTLKTENLGFSVENGVSKTKKITTASGEKVWKKSYNVLVKDLSNTSIAHTSGLINGDIITEVSFGGATYSAADYFACDYELKDLLVKVNLSCNEVKFKISRLGAEQIITISLTAENFVEIK